MEEKGSPGLLLCHTVARGTWHLVVDRGGKKKKRKEKGQIRDRSFFMREGELVGFGGGPLEQNWLERGGQPKKMKERGGGQTKKLD